jgi:hypothetical protein
MGLWKYSTPPPMEDKKHRWKARTDIMGSGADLPSIRPFPQGILKIYKKPTTNAQ